MNAYNLELDLRKIMNELRRIYQEEASLPSILNLSIFVGETWQQLHQDIGNFERTQGHLV
jgi:hypothetical protein